MHIIGILIAVATLIYWVSRASKGVGDIADAANTVANLPRRRRFSKKYHRSGYDLVETPVEAATVLMISAAKMGQVKSIMPEEEETIISHLTTSMGLDTEEADGLYRQMHSLTYDLTLPENALFPMTAILKADIDKKEAEELAQMMDSVAASSGDATPDQSEFIRRFRERMGLLH